MKWCTVIRGAVIGLGLQLAATLVGQGGIVAGAAEPLAADASVDRAKDILLLALGDCTSDKLHAQRHRIELPQRLSGPTINSSEYPPDQLQQGHQAVLLIYFLVDSLGNARFPHASYALPLDPDSSFLEAAIGLVRRNTYSPLKVDDGARASWVRYPVKFVLEEARGPMGRLLDEASWDALLKKAHDGDVIATKQVVYIAHLLGTMQGLDEPLLVESALHGEDSARFQILKTLSACARDSVADQWIFEDANAGSSEARIWWADLLIKSNDPEFLPKARDLLEQVATSNDAFMRLWAAGILATSPVAAIRDPALALSVASALNHQLSAIYSRDPDYAELLAAAQAANGQYAEAMQSEHQAIERASALHWNVTALQSRLDSYAANKAWRGYLCDCEQLRPDQEYVPGDIRE